MSITTTVCDTYTLEAMQGIHVIGDTYKLALIKPASSGAHGASTTNYSDLGADEVATGGGYTAGGITLTGAAAALAAGVSKLDFNDATWPAATFSAAGALIYNASKANRAVAVLSFGATFTGLGGNFSVPMADPVQATSP